MVIARFIKIPFPGGIIYWLEKLLERKVYWVICQLHTNELPLRHLIEALGKIFLCISEVYASYNLDGKTTSKDGFSGPIGKLLSKVNEVARHVV